MADSDINIEITEATPISIEIVEDTPVSLEITTSGPAGVVQSIVAGSNVTVDDTDPANPIVNATGGGGTQTYDEYIYNSSGTQEDNRYNDWDDLYAAFRTNGQDGPIRITFEQNETLPTGTYNLDYVTLNGDGKIATLGGLVVTMPEGFNISGDWINGMLDGGLGVNWTASYPALIYSSGINLFTMMIGNVITCTQAPFFDTRSGSINIFRLNTGSRFTNNGYEVVKSESGTANYVITGSGSAGFNNNIFRGDIDLFSGLILVDSPASNIDPTRTDANMATPYQIILSSNSGLIGYDNTISGLSSTTVKTAIDELAASSGGSPAWGNITGTLSNQTDLQNALDAKVTSVVAGTGISVDNTNPQSPIVSSTTGTLVSRTVNQTGHGLSVGDIVRISGGTYVKAQADSLANAMAVGMVQTVTDANNFIVASEGYITGLSISPASTLFYLSPTTAGALTSTKPTTVGQVVKPIYFSVGTTRGYLNCNFEPTLVKTASRAMVSDTNGDVVASSVTSTELGYVSGVTSAIQTQIDSKKTDSMSTNKLLGRGTASTGAIEEITLGTGLSLSGTTLNASASGSDFDNVLIAATARFAGTGAAPATTLVKTMGGASTLSIAAGRQLLALTGGSGQTIASLYILVSATALTGSQTVDITAYEDLSDGGPGTVLWTESIVVGTSTGTIVKTGLSRAIPTGKYWLSVLNPSGNAGAVTLRVSTYTMGSRVAIMANENFQPVYERTGVASAGDLSAIVFRQSIASTEIAPTGTVFPIVGARL